MTDSRDRILARNRAILAGNLDLLDGFFGEYPDWFEWRRPDGGCVAYPKYTGPGSVEDLCRRLVEEAGVLFLPASIYRSELLESPAGHFRVGCGRCGMAEGLAAVRAFLESWGG